MGLALNDTQYTAELQAASGEEAKEKLKNALIWS